MQVVVDRIEGSMAVLEVEGQIEIELPLKFLPKDVKDGSVLTMTFEIDKPAEQEKIRKVKALQDKLRNRK